MNIILYLLLTIQDLYRQNLWLLSFICRYIPLRQFEFDDSHSPEYQKFKTDILPKIIPVRHEDWQHLLREWQRSHNGRELLPIRRRGDCDIPNGTRCPCCGAPMEYLYRNNGKHGQLQCKVCGTRFSSDALFHKKYQLKCPFCGHALVPVKDRKFFTVWKCVNPKCPYYQDRLKHVRPGTPNGFDGIEGANYNLSLWVAYYNFLRPHMHNHYQVLNPVLELGAAKTMPGKWQILMRLGQETMLRQQTQQSVCS